MRHRRLVEEIDDRRELTISFDHMHAVILSVPRTDPGSGFIRPLEARVAVPTTVREAHTIATHVRVRMSSVAPHAAPLHTQASVEKA